MPGNWFVPAMDYALVGGYPEQKKGNSTVWDGRARYICHLYNFIIHLTMYKIIISLLVVNLVILSCSSKKDEKQISPPSTETAAVNEYPDIVLVLADGGKIQTRALKGNNIFILFQPDCDHCQEEAIHIEQRLDEFKEYTLYFISSAPMEQIKGFAQNFDLDGKKNVRFAWTTTEGVLTHYGPIPTPSVYIYSNGRLKQSFQGQTDIENILGAL